METFVVRDVVEADGSATRALEARVSVRNAMGVAQYGQLSAPYAEGYGDVTFEQVFIEKPDGRRVVVDLSETEDVNPFGMSPVPMPADFRIRRLTVPGLAAGDRLSYRVVIRQKPMFPDLVFGEYKFLMGPGTAEQVYELDAPADLKIRLWRRGDLPAEWETPAVADARRRHRLTLRTPIPMPEADPAGAAALLEPDVAYTSFRSWPEMARWWWGVSKDRFVADDAVRAEAARLGAAPADVPARIAALHAFVSGQVRYLSVGFGSGRYEPRPAAEVLSTRYGDCKGKHALLAALASAGGVEVWPVLVHSTRKDLHDDVPSPMQFDHLISVVRVGKEPAGGSGWTPRTISRRSVTFRPTCAASALWSWTARGGRSSRFPRALRSPLGCRSRSAAPSPPTAPCAPACGGRCGTTSSPCCAPPCASRRATSGRRSPRGWPANGRAACSPT